MAERTLSVDPIGIQIRQRSLITGMFYGLRRLLVDDAARPSPPSRICLTHLGIRGRPVWSRVEFRREGDGPGDQKGRQFGGIDEERTRKNGIVGGRGGKVGEAERRWQRPRRS